MNYWHMQLHPNDLNWSKEKEVLEKYNLIGLGDWEEQISQQDDFENKMKVGDIVAIKRGSQFIALTKVIGEYEYTDEVGDLDWFQRRRKVEILDWYKKDYNFYVSPRGTLTRCNTNNSDAQSNISITNWYKTSMMNYLQNKTIDLLKYKNQIILQGPPGTGKTRQAKLIAEELIKPKKVGNPESIIDNLLEKFNPNEETLKAYRENNERLLAKFQELFPKGTLSQITLEKYCTGKGDRDNFCWWIERGLQPLGYYFPGSSRSYLIFWKKDIEEYSKHGFVKDVQDDEEAMQKVADVISEVVNEQKIDNAVNYFGDSFLLKLLNTYYPNEYFPINSERMIDNALKIFKVNYQGLNAFEKNKKLNQIYLEKKAKFLNQITAYEFGRLLWDNFNLKTGEDINHSDELIAQGEFQIIQFHPAYSYEDFVRGIIAETTENGNVTYKVENKILAEFAQKSKDNPNGNYVLIIDEINRANLPSVLGELIYALEYRNEPVTSMYEFENERNIILPKNLFIIGTMNTADRSVGHIDYAIRRRFAFVDILPDESVIANEKAKQLFNDVKILFSDEFLSPDFKPKDVMIGHSYFLTNDDNELKTKLEFEIKPILREYLKDGIFFEIASEKIEALNV
ncbi:AAA domain-containing protein [Pedobacter sp. BS3]|uniref:McrB family protein n=1 Tax=Pedobacter sp. BS3 TaxID=2567937 RepID=UPI0011EC0037|nr:AAA family ATPase [Pedobacter sp. BS3]TZF83924.1 AAA domain-containing protein [Pedobacter sp. BS3]